MHREHIKDFMVMKKPPVVMQYMINKNNCLATRVNTSGYPQMITKLPIKTNFSKMFMGPGRYFHILGDP